MSGWEGVLGRVGGMGAPGGMGRFQSRVSCLGGVCKAALGDKLTEASKLETS